MSYLDYSSSACLLGLLAGIWLLRGCISAHMRRKRMPPGPRGLPLLGNALQIPIRMPWLRFTEWKEVYGPIYSLNLAGQDVVVLSSHTVAFDLLDRRSSIYSDRPRLIMAGEMLTGGMAMVFARYGSFWRRLRGAARHGFSTKAVEKYQATLASEAAQAAFDIVQTPADWEKRLKRAIASSILRATYGWPQIKEEESELITRMEAHIARLTNALISAALLIDFFPIIKYVPTWMAKWKRDALEWHKRDTRMFEGFYDGVRRKKMNDQQSDCFVSTLIENEERNGFTQKENAWLAGILFTAGAETTASAMSYFVLAMTLYPDVMRKAQAELDAVVGRERLPTFADQAQLPYINALCKEVLRWRPVGPLAVPRRTIKDDWYEGYLIPKGTIVIPNVWAINRDSNVYPDFDVFHPERFLDDAVEKTLAPLTHSMGHVTYGFGRRICAGYNFANQAMFIDIATLLWAFDIEKAVDEFGHVIVPSSTECIDAGAAVSPAPFKCRITPRFHEVEAILKWEQASRSE